MRRFGTAIAIAIVLLALISGGLVIYMSIEKAQALRAGEKHLLVQAKDVAAFGEVRVLTPESTIEKGGLRDYGLLNGWVEGRVTDLVVIMPGGKNGVLVNSAFYKFPSASAAQAALDALPDPIEHCSWKSLVKDASLLDKSLVELLSGHSWRIWQGIDDEGVPAYVLWIQFGSYVSEVHINAAQGQEAFARQLLNHITAQLVSRVEQE